MTLHDLSILRFKNQQITGSKFRTVKDLAGWMGAVQAQDYTMSKWAFGIRLMDSTETLINDAIDTGEILRMHLLRPTWHFFSSDDACWMLELTAPQVKASMRFRDKQLGLTGTILRKSNSIIERSIRNSGHQTRDELISEFKKAGIDVSENRAYHLLVRAETDGIICSGRSKGNKPTYALLSERMPVSRRFSRDEALKELAGRYFASHGPATLHDFSWWSGLSLTDSKSGLESVKQELVSEKVEDQTYWFAGSVPRPDPDPEKVFLLPAYDEFVISYRDRSAMLYPPSNKKAISGNGVFYPTIIKDGKVIGTWKRTINKGILNISVNLFDGVDQDITLDIVRASSVYAKFTGEKTEVNSG